MYSFIVKEERSSGSSPVLVFLVLCSSSPRGAGDPGVQPGKQTYREPSVGSCSSAVVGMSFWALPVPVWFPCPSCCQNPCLAPPTLRPSFPASRTFVGFLSSSLFFLQQFFLDCFCWLRTFVVEILLFTVCVYVVLLGPVRTRLQKLMWLRDPRGASPSGSTGWTGTLGTVISEILEMNEWLLEMKISRL